MREIRRTKYDPDQLKSREKDRWSKGSRFDASVWLFFECLCLLIAALAARLNLADLVTHKLWEERKLWSSLYNQYKALNSIWKFLVTHHTEPPRWVKLYSNNSVSVAERRVLSRDILIRCLTGVPNQSSADCHSLTISQYNFGRVEIFFSHIIAI